MSVGVALIGGGIWAREEHLPAIQAAPDLSLKAVFSRTKQSARSIIDLSDPSVALYSDEGTEGFAALLKRTDISAVIISLPINNQAPYIKEALLAGKHVLSEKPVGGTVQDAIDIIKWYRSEIKDVSWSIAENWRFLKSYEFAAQELKSMGRIIGFQGRQHAFVPQTGKFYQTAWRKNPTHQGGFILDSGVHYMAGIRQLLDAQPGNRIARVSAFSNQVQSYLPPVDTIDAVFQLESGVTGAFQISVGTSLRENSWTIACEGGCIRIEDSKVTISRDGQETEKTVPNEKTGVPPEVREWGKALAAGRILKEQEPEPALADLELIELMIQSGDAGGAPLKCSHQQV